MSTSAMRTPSPGTGDRSLLTRELLAAAHATADPQRRRELLDDVIVINRRVADAVAMRYRGRGVDLEDLQQAAYEGLVKAVLGYDPGRADDLLTFAVPTIRGEVQRHFRDRSWVVRPPRRLQELQSRVNRAVDDLSLRLGREPGHDEVRAEVGVSGPEYAEVLGTIGCFTPPSLDQPAGPEGGATLGDLVAAAENDGWAAVEARCVLAGALFGLGARDRRILQLRFVEQLTQAEIGDELGISQNRVSRTLHRILADLRARVGELTHDQPSAPAGLGAGRVPDPRRTGARRHLMNDRQRRHACDR